MNQDSQSYVDLELINQKLKELDQQLEHIEMKLEQSVLAKNMMTALQKAKAGDEILVPIGAGSFITVNAGDISQVKQAVGSGIVVEKSIKDALVVLETQQQTLLANQKQLAQEYEATVERAIALQTKIESTQQQK